MRVSIIVLAIFGFGSAAYAAELTTCFKDKGTNPCIASNDTLELQTTTYCSFARQGGSPNIGWVFNGGDTIVRMYSTGFDAFRDCSRAMTGVVKQCLNQTAPYDGGIYVRSNATAVIHFCGSR